MLELACEVDPDVPVEEASVSVSTTPGGRQTPAKLGPAPWGYENPESQESSGYAHRPVGAQMPACPPSEQSESWLHSKALAGWHPLSSKKSSKLLRSKYAACDFMCRTVGSRDTGWTPEFASSVSQRGTRPVALSERKRR